jgi:aminoglycoside phosphotransferase (APT) family kinase protein
MSELPKREAQGPQALLARLAAEFPELSWQSYEYVDRGWDHEVLILDGRLVFRFPNDDLYLRRLRAEVEILERIGPLAAVRVPRYAHVAADGSFAGYPLVPGVALTKQHFDSLPVDERAEIARQLAGLLSLIHTFAGSQIDFAMVAASDLEDSQAEIKAQARARLPAVLSRRDMALVEEIIADSDLLLAEPISPVLIHGDIYGEHLLWDAREQRLGVIDFSDMNLGDAAFDFAELHEYGDNFVNDVYRRYDGPKDVRFIERSWRYLRWVAVYMMTDHFIYHKTSFETARATFDLVKRRRYAP